MYAVVYGRGVLDSSMRVLGASAHEISLASGTRRFVIEGFAERKSAVNLICHLAAEWHQRAATVSLSVLMSHLDEFLSNHPMPPEKAL